MGDQTADLSGWAPTSAQQIRQASAKLAPASPDAENAAFDLARAAHEQAVQWEQDGRPPVLPDGSLDPQFVEEVVQQAPDAAAVLVAEQAAAHVPPEERLSIGEAVALGVTTQHTLPARQVRQGLARAVKTVGRDGDLDTALQDELGVGSEAVFGQRAQQAEEVVHQMQGAGLANELGRQLVETVGESLERNPRLTVQQFREGGSPARLARMRQWDRATGDPEVTDRIVDGLIGLGALPEATVKEIPMPPAPSLAPSVVSTEPETTAPAAQPAEASATPTSPTVEQYDSGLFERLRAWRLEAAQQQGQKAFYVFPDATLQRIAAARPQSLDDLQAVKGVGPKKLEQYGQAVLDITRQGAEDPQAKEQEV